MQNLSVNGYVSHLRFVNFVSSVINKIRGLKGDACNRTYEIFQLFDIWRYQSLVILFFSSVVILI